MKYYNNNKVIIGEKHAYLKLDAEDLDQLAELFKRSAAAMLGDQDADNTEDLETLEMFYAIFAHTAEEIRTPLNPPENMWELGLKTREMLLAFQLRQNVNE